LDEEKARNGLFLLRENRGLHKAKLCIINNEPEGKECGGIYECVRQCQDLCYVSENEGMSIRQRQAEGIVSAKARGVRFEPITKELPDNFFEIVRQKEEGKISLKETLEQTGLSQTTYYRRLREYQK